MSSRRVLRAHDAYPRDRRGQQAAAYSAEHTLLESHHPPYVPYGQDNIDRDEAERLTEQVYARYAPNRKRPRVVMPNYKRRYKEGVAFYDPTRHLIWAPAGILDCQMMLHELAHSLTWKRTWFGHGPEFMRMLIELNCWFLGISVHRQIRRLRAITNLDVPDKLRFGDDPTKVDWVRK